MTNRQWIDPVCGMRVEPPAGVSLRWNGKTYRFCHRACRDTFQDEPTRWAEPMRHVDERVAH